MVEAEALLGCHLVLGPARSGKSRWAEYLALRSGLAVTYLATGPGASAADPAWMARVLAHRQRRPPSWSTREVGAALPEALASLSPPGLALVDSLGTWVAAGLELDALDWQQRCSSLYECLLALPIRPCWSVSRPVGGWCRQRPLAACFEIGLAAWNSNWRPCAAACGW